MTLARDLQQGSYRFGADYDGVQFWSAQANNCTLPGCASTTVTLPGGTGETTTTIDYTYDPLYRLTNADYSTGDSYQYAYDSVGNRLTQESMVHGLSSTVNFAYDSANRLTSVDGVNYTFDANGNLLNDGQNTYAYDSANRLIAVSGQQSATYAYNGLGDRLSQNGVQYTLDLNAGLTQVLDDGTTSYTYGLGRISQQQGSTAEYFLGDALGSVKQLVNDVGEVTLTNSYDPYGVVTQTSGAGQSAYGYTGEAQDASGLTYLRARYYSSYLNQFIQPDTIVPDPRIPADWNRYSYVRNNPINFTDPSGYIAEKDAKRADFLLEKLNNVFNIQIKKDWGYLNDLFYVNPSIRTWSDCQWMEGNWRDIKELELTFEAVKDMSKVLGTQGLFRTAMRWQPIRLYRISSEYVTIVDDDFGGYSINNVILPNNAFDSTDAWAKGTVVHELAHVMDYRQWWPPFRLSDGMAARTKSFKEVCVIGRGGVKSCHLVYDPTGEAAPTDYAHGHPREDWAESFRFFVYPSFGYLGPIRKSYIESVIKDLRTP